MSEYTRVPVPGLPGVYFRDMTLALPTGELQLRTASAVDVLTARTDSERPYWAVAWPAGLALARYLCTLPLAGMSVLELGCGVAAAGLGAALGGAAVTATDNQPAALRLARMNARRNGLPLRLLAADWRAWPLASRFDLVIGSDVTYAPEAFDALLETLEETVAAEGEVLLTDPGRLTTTAFLQRATLTGWSWQETPLPREGGQAVFLYRVRRLCS